jgi:hypothetical protein
VTVGQAVGIVEIVGSVALGSVLLLVVWQVGNVILSQASAAGSTTAASDATRWLGIGMRQGLPVFFLFVIVGGAIARAAYQRRRRP